jgi:hypothetical protein
MKNMQSAMAICALALGTSACTAPEAEFLPPNTTLVGKCAFTAQATSDIEPGDVFLYALRDDDNGDLIVVTGSAATSDSLLDVVVQQSLADNLPARRDADNLEFGGLTADRGGEADHFVGMGQQPGQMFTSIGTTYGTQIAYPSCVFWE